VTRNSYEPWPARTFVRIADDPLDASRNAVSWERDAAHLHEMPTLRPRESAFPEGFVGRPNHWRREIAALTTVPDGGYAIHKGRTLTISDTSYSWFDHDRRLPERGFLRDGTPYRNLAGILARLKIRQRNIEAQRNRI
jgi:hypothetical protein